MSSHSYQLLLTSELVIFLRVMIFNVLLLPLLILVMTQEIASIGEKLPLRRSSECPLQELWRWPQGMQGMACSKNPLLPETDEIPPAVNIRLTHVSAL